MLAASACAIRTVKAAKNQPPPAAAAAAKTPATETATAEPVSIPQTQVVLPPPQPIQAEALAPAPPELPPAQPKPTATPKPQVPAAARTEARTPTAPAGPPPPPPSTTPATRRRIRPVESEANLKRMQDEIQGRQRQALDLVAKAKSRPMSDQDKITIDRIQAFLDQTTSALKEKDLQQAEALSNRALLLCHELSPER